ncbi:MAG: hypothetical protein HY858_15955 [Candidatus Solibacter usitatus]|nr:hypothetical protein [Candidatus Solibacter usitatus]
MNSTKITNAAGRIPLGLPNHGAAPGGLFSLEGLGAGSESLLTAAGFPLPTAGLGGFRLRLTTAGAALDIPVLELSPAGLVALLPSSAPPGEASIEVTNPRGAKASSAMRIVPAAPGLFSRNGRGSGPGVISNVADSGELTLNSLVNSARPGQRVALWATGLGRIEGDEIAGELPGERSVDLEVFVGGKLAPIASKTRSGCTDGLPVVPFRACAGVDRIDVQIPELQGCHVPVAVRAGGVISNHVSIAVAPDGGRCSDPGGLQSSDYETLPGEGNVTFGSVALVRAEVGSGSSGTMVDSALASFQRLDLARFFSLRGLGIETSPGACSVYAYTGEALIGQEEPVQGQFLSAGPELTLRGPQGIRPLKSKAAAAAEGAAYEATLGTSTIIDGNVYPGSGTPFLEPGAYELSAGGGVDVGAFSVSFNLARKAAWKRNTSPFTGLMDTVVRSKDYLVEWTGGEEGKFVVFYGSADSGSADGGGSASFFCLERAEKGSLTVPAYILQSLPGGGGTEIPGFGIFGGKPGILALISGLADVRSFQAPGIHLSSLTASHMDASTAAFQ